MPAYSWITDVVRGSLVASSAEQILDIWETLKVSFKRVLGTERTPRFHWEFTSGVSARFKRVLNSVEGVRAFSVK